MASQPLVQGPLFGAPASRFDFNKREFVKTPSPSPESSPEKEEANLVEIDLAALDIHDEPRKMLEETAAVDKAKHTAAASCSDIVSPAGARDKEAAVHGEYNPFDFFDVLDMLSEDASRGEDILSQVQEPQAVATGACKAPTLTIGQIFAESAAKMKKYKTVTRLVSQEDIDRLIRRPPPPSIPSFFFEHEGLDPQLAQALASTAANVQAVIDSEKDIVDQYYANGYAYAKFTVID